MVFYLLGDLPRLKIKKKSIIKKVFKFDLKTTLNSFFSYFIHRKIVLTSLREFAVSGVETYFLNSFTYDQCLEENVVPSVEPKVVYIDQYLENHPELSLIHI